MSISGHSSTPRPTPHSLPILSFEVRRCRRSRFLDPQGQVPLVAASTCLFAARGIGVSLRRDRYLAAVSARSTSPGWLCGRTERLAAARKPLVAIGVDVEVAVGLIFPLWSLQGFGRCGVFFFEELSAVRVLE